jgi:hypothetical protein
MRQLLILLLAAAPCLAAAQEVARIFDQPLFAKDIGLSDAASRPAAAAALRQRAMKAALERFVAGPKGQATEEDLEAYAKWNEEFQRLDKARRARRLAEVEAALAKPGIAALEREQLARERELYRSLAKTEATREAASRDAGSRQRVWSQWITGFKANKALYEKYGGRVGLTKFGPEPIGAIEALLQERAKAGDLVITDATLAKEFWSWYASQPRRVARPEEIDFTFYWLKPPHDPDSPRR